MAEEAIAKGIVCNGRYPAESASNILSLIVYATEQLAPLRLD